MVYFMPDPVITKGSKPSSSFDKRSHLHVRQDMGDAIEFVVYDRGALKSRMPRRQMEAARKSRKARGEAWKHAPPSASAPDEPAREKAREARNAVAEPPQTKSAPTHGAPRRALGRRTSGAALQLRAPRGTLRAAGREAGGPLGVSVHLP